MGPRPLQILLLTAVLCYAGAWLALAGVVPQGLPILWPVTAVALAAMLRLPLRWTPAVAAVALAAALAAAAPPFGTGEALAFGLIHVAEATFACLLLRRQAFDPRFRRLADVWKLFAAGPLIAGVAASLGAAGLFLALHGAPGSYFGLARTWFMYESIGLLLVTPLLLSFPPLGLPAAAPARWRLASADALLLGAALLAVAGVWFSGEVGAQVRGFVFFPLALVAAARYPQRWAPVIAGAVGVLVALAIADGVQPFGPLPPREAALTAQAFVFIVALTTLGLAVLLGEVRRHQGELLQRVAERTAELQKANERLAHLATVDFLTGVGNRRQFDRALAAEAARSRRHAQPLSLVLVDLDHFKRVNDLRGHAAGDEALREVGRTLQACARAADVVARFGGEEFAVILPHTTLEQAQRFAERARGAVAALPLAITASFGAAQLGAQGDVEGLLAAADQALYRAKAGGRDRVEAAQALGV
jgi:diguanylate cyclase (GGDEF)-like protein